MKINDLLAENHRSMQRSEIRELLKLTAVPGMISLGGGLPDPQYFPVERIRVAFEEIMETDAVAALQYGTTEGDNVLREELVRRYQALGFRIKLENLVIVSGSQQALDLLGKVFINKCDTILCESPSYLGAIGAFLSYGGELIDIPMDSDGISLEELTSSYEALKQSGRIPKFLYLIPDYQNPSGIHMSLSRRQQILAYAYENDILVVEDSPYREFNFEGERLPSLYEMRGGKDIIHLGTFSKTFMPGLRIGWIIASEEIIDRFVIAKQNTDLCTSPLTQKIAALFLQKGWFDDYLEIVKREYKVKRDEMIKALHEFMPEEVTWFEPNGGLFFFINFPERMNATELLKKAIEKKVAFVPGSAFFPFGKGYNHARINFSYSSIENNRIAVQRLASLIREEMASI
ncbi:MAG: PLP-dependent aminotransferase family protein [Candidatus Cloacimonetes bacterium]|nr:PLP-dependent aminotransferase family protein [Candidatus Cloacimonadota bacterium]